MILSSTSLFTILTSTPALTSTHFSSADPFLDHCKPSDSQLSLQTIIPNNCNRRQQKKNPR